MKGIVEDRCVILGRYIAENNATVRSAAKVFGVSKSTVHKDITVVLPKVNSLLAQQVKKVLMENKAQRHLRGGMATKNKYSAFDYLYSYSACGGLFVVFVCGE